MTLPVPHLDDRAFLDLVTEARERIRRSCPDWTDLSAHDPGMALLEAFAYLTEVMIYRLNQLPEKAYVAFLNLLGVARHPPTAAWADVRFSRTGPDRGAVRVPAGTRVAAARGADPRPVVFVTTEPALLPEGETEVTVRMHHCEPVEAELLGVGTGQAGQVFRAARAPLTRTTEALDLLLGVEVPTGSVELGAAAREHEGRTYEIWRPVDSFAGVGPQAKVYLVDRASGVVTFAPALDLRPPAGPETGPDAGPDVEGVPGPGIDGLAPGSGPATGDAAAGGGAGPAAGGPGEAARAPRGLVTVAAVPPAGRQIRLWYRCGGGPAGNVAAGTLTSLRDPLPGLRVDNPEPAGGGRDLESLESALTRGPYEFFAQQRAVTARDYEILAAGSGAVARARAFTRAAVYSFARPGEVEVVLVPYVPEQARPGGRLPVGVLREHEVEEARRRVEADLDRRRALGTAVRAGWARYKAVSIRARVVVRREEDVDAVRSRIHDRLHQTLSPLPTPLNPTGWAFGEPLRASNVYRMLEHAEPGVRYVESVRFVVDEAPDAQVRTVAVDQYQPGTWYAGRGPVLFRSTNAGAGWEPAGRFDAETVVRVVPAPAPVRPGVVPRAGSVAVVTARDAGGSRVRLSTDLGETWTLLTDLDSRVQDLAWIDRDGAGALLLATDAGLYEVSLLPGSVPLQILVDPADADRGFYAVRAFVSERGAPGVAVAAQAGFGVYLSTAAGRPGTFAHVGLANVDNRVLAVQYDGPATLLWCGAGEPDPKKPGQGCHRTRLFESDVKWQAVQAGWIGGTCRDLAFSGTLAVAATQSGGVVRLDTLAAQPQWQPVMVNCGLPLRDRTRFVPVDAIAATGGPDRLILAGGERGVYRTGDAVDWTASANQATADVVTVPGTWLLCSGEHDIEVVRQDAPNRD
ncbi:putative baseplate assembly protein [Micromonospora sp. DR5-3]|uniref:putative baseplate assembly protein n=1 Tax=unclassified Micromonospora TaxID=2617518 RepID=UPI0011D7CAF4|nr:MULTISPECIES: putative baseplate assembly protein [unclassified Micromonospora]MCW3819474.1 putative baseplate assembly protein [Micromonospora sp. DR5-3]TYC19152.1 putative baseplate assembly protein [Micromonospora sp. MP36]